MNDICVPIPRFAVEQSAEVAIKIAQETKRFNYRVESFDWLPEEKLSEGNGFARIENLKNRIEGYDKKWEIIQIYNPGPRDDRIQVLFREKIN
jgi:hypothetical protein